MRRRFMRRALGYAIGGLLVVVAFAALATWLLTVIVGPQAVSVVVSILLIVLIGRAVVGGIRHRAVPFGDLIEASARVRAGQVGTQVEERGPDEVRELARAFNAMSSRLAADTADRRRLLADVSHELRTPLTVIQGNVEAMLDGVYPADREHLERILAETHQLERLIEDLRTLALAESGSLGLQREPTDLRALAADVVAGFEPQAAAAGVHLVVERQDDVPELDLDPMRIRQVVTNLVSNALRHTRRGGTVTVALRRDGAAVVLDVTDTGSGMDADTAARAFDRFWRSPESPGAGLGLPIVRDLVGAHGGSVELRSEPGVGTRVHCRLPIPA